MRAWVFGLVVGVVGVAAACTTDYQKGADDPNYGAPNALAGQKAPGSTSDVLPSDGGGTGAGQYACGTPLADGGACAVSWKNDIMPTLISPTSGCLGASCHDPGKQAPTVSSDPTATYMAFAQFKISDGNKIYIDPCSTDATKSTFACNLQGTAGCGSKMPLGKTYDPAAITKVSTWLACGSPNN